MTPNQRIWARARDELAGAIASLGYPEAFAELLAKELGSPRAIERLTSWVYQARPGSMESIVDEMLAISADMRAWREKKESREAQERYSAWLNSDLRWHLGENDE